MSSLFSKRSRFLFAGFWCAAFLLPALACGIPPKDASCPTSLVDYVEGRDGTRWTRPLVIKKVVYLSRLKDTDGKKRFRMNRTEIEKQRHREVKELIGISGSYLVELATKLVAPLWDDVLRAAEVNVLEARVSIFLTPEEFHKAVAILYRRGVNVTAGVLQDDKSASTTRILKREFGAGITGAQVYYAGYKHYLHDWRKALTGADLDAEAIIRYHYWTKEELIEMVKTLHTEKVALNALELFTPRFRTALWKHFRVRQSGESFYRTAISRFGSWDNMLRAANLDPVKIRKYLWRRGNLSTESYQFETWTDGSGRATYGRYLGAPPPTAHQALVEKEAVEAIWAVLKKLPETDRRVGEWVLDDILGHTRRRDAETIAATITLDSGTPISKQRVEEILALFADLSV